MNETSPKAVRHGAVGRWSPALLVEAVLVVFAVLVALAVDEWWEERENVELAERATTALIREIRTNRNDVVLDEDPDIVLSNLTEALEAFRQDRKPDELSINWDVALLSSAAWETARVTRATQYMPLDRVINIAELYEFQRLFTEQQDELVSLIARFESRMETDPVPALIEFRGRYASIVRLRESLATLYACTLTEIEGPTAPEAADCPREPAN